MALPVILLTIFIIPTSIAGIANALPSIAVDLGSNPTGLQWVVNGFNASFAIFTLVWGVLSDRIGYKTTFVAGAALMVVASIASATAPNLFVLDIARIVAGAAGAAIFTAAASTIANAYEPVPRARNFAIFGTVLGLGLAVGPTLAGGLVAAFGWRGVFVTFAIIVGTALALSPFVPHIKHEREPGRKLVDFSLLRNPHFLAIVLVPVTQAFGYIALLTYLPIALSAVHGIDAGVAGLLMLPMTIPVFVGPFIGERLVAKSRHFSLMTIIYISLALMILGDVGMLLLAARAPIAVLILPMLLLGLAFGLPLGLLDGAAQSAVPARSSGTAAGVMNFLRLGSEAIVVGGYAAVVAWLISLRLGNPEAEDVAAGKAGHAADYLHAFTWAEFGLIAFVILGAVAIVLLHRAKTRGGRIETELADAPEQRPSEAIEA
jgi:predicted MFS family arabinose efflux permease